MKMHKLTLKEFQEAFEGRDVPADIEDGHGGKRVVGRHEETIRKQQVTRIGESDDHFILNR